MVLAQIGYVNYPKYCFVLWCGVWDACMKNNGRNSTPISHLQIDKVWKIKHSQFVIFVGPIMFGRALWTIFVLFFVLNIFLLGHGNALCAQRHWQEPMSKQRNTPLMDWWLRKWQLMLYPVRRCVNRCVR
jgi:hypothetical protein